MWSEADPMLTPGGKLSIVTVQSMADAAALLSWWSSRAAHEQLRIWPRGAIHHQPSTERLRHVQQLFPAGEPVCIAQMAYGITD